MGARFYNPQAGRFITRDSYKGNIYQPWTHNLYTYCNNNPVKYYDPTGYAAIFVSNQYNYLSNLAKNGTAGEADWARQQLAENRYYIDTDNPNGGYLSHEESVKIGFYRYSDEEETLKSDFLTDKQAETGLFIASFLVPEYKFIEGGE